MSAQLYAPASDIWERSVLPRLDRRPGPLATECWIFTGCLQSRGYGCVTAGRRGKTVLTHRLAVAVRDGVLTDLPIDHLCMVRACCNPDHLDVVTTSENNRRSRSARGYRIGGTCGVGHPLTEESTYHSPRGRLVCRACANATNREFRRGRSDVAHVREWLIANGHPVGSRGRIAAELTALYLDAHMERAA